MRIGRADGLVVDVVRRSAQSGRPRRNCGRPGKKARQSMKTQATVK